MIIPYGFLKQPISDGICELSDADACLFVENAGITEPTQRNAINQLVIDLKNANIWTKMFAIYPYVGGTADAHKYNLKDPQDTDAAFRLTWYGGVTHDANGYTTNDINNDGGHTQFNPSTDGMTSIDGGMTACSYVKVDQNQYIMGSTAALEFSILSRSTLAGGRVFSGSFCGASPVDGLLGKGVVTINRIGTSNTAWKDSVLIKTITNTGTVTNGNLDVGRAVGRASDRGTYCFNAMHNGLTATEIANFHTAIDTFSTALSRKNW